ncbi:MAG: hypothetical protein P8Y69_17870 [Gammaproteobacteria bacterium]|jgi:hypothetical protein
MTHPQVGDQDPEQKNSPIAIESEEETQLLRQEVPGEAICYFNGEAFEQDTVVQSGSTLLRCDRGIWVPVGNVDAEHR